MAKFNARIIDASGNAREEIIEAADKMSAYADAKARGEMLVSASEVGAKKGILHMEISLFNRVSMRDKYMFARNLGAMIEAGLPLARALTVIEKQTKKKYFKGIIAALNKSVAEGKTLSEAMAAYPKVFPNLMASMVRSGEESGSLSQALRMVAAQMESTYKLMKKIRGALMYPAVIMGAIVVMGIFMLVYVVPTLTQTFKDFGTELPASTRFVIWVSDTLKDHFALSLLAIGLVVAGAVVALRTKGGKRGVDWATLRMPAIGGIAKEVNAARTARTLSSLLSSGVDIVLAAKITGDVLQNSYYKEILAQVGEKVQKGEPIADIFHANEKLYPSFVGEMIAVGEETGQLSDMLQGVAVFYENEVEQKTKDLTSIVEPFLMIVIGLAVGFFAISMISPIYSLTNAIT